MARSDSRRITAVGLKVSLCIAAILAPWIGFRAASITPEDRIDCQKVIEHTRYSHRLGAKQPFAEVVNHDVLERKVLNYLKQSAALEQLWDTVITDSMLNAELQRMTRQSSDPVRLQELFDRLGGDPALIRECIGRPALAERLSRQAFDYDAGIHAATRREAERVRALVGTIGQVREELHAFVVESVLGEEPERTVLARQMIPKRSYDDWWRDAAPRFGVDLSLSPPDQTHATLDDPPDPVNPRCALDDTWVALEEPDERWSHVAVWTGAEMIVWGGYDGSAHLNSGRRFDPVTATWEAISITDAPSARIQCTAVWTGQEMIVWGGTGSTNTGGRYNPASDSWTPTSTVNAPEGRWGHTAVWTGTEMIVHGGVGSSQYLLTGGRYDPDADAWQATSTGYLGTGHSAVWTGSRMILWGGGDDFGCTNGGRSYDPQTDSWESTSGVDAPQARAYHTAVWTGSEMLVWGGLYYVTLSGISDSLDNGAYYSPDTDTWTPLSAVGAPSARRGHTAVWTGDEMIVWGGSPSTGSTGGRYSLATDSWMPTTLSAAPQGRTTHTAVWTGLEMIIAGALSSGTTPVEGGRYFAGNADLDSDGIAGDCDCASLDPNHIEPDEVAELTASRPMPDIIRLHWVEVSSADSYSVTSGSLSSLALGDYGGCLAAGIVGSSFDDGDVPAVGSGFTYLVQSEGELCGSSTLGQSSGEEERVNLNPAACP